MFKRTVGTVLCGAAVALSFAGSAEAATIHTTWGLLGATPKSIVVVAPGRLTAGDCVLLAQQPIILDLGNQTFSWTAQILTKASPDPDVWHATFQFKKANGDDIGPAIHVDGPQMTQINHKYLFTSRVVGIHGLSFPFPARTVVETSSC
jgi:hypothetical protein